MIQRKNETHEEFLARRRAYNHSRVKQPRTAQDREYGRKQMQDWRANNRERAHEQHIKDRAKLKVKDPQYFKKKRAKQPVILSLIEHARQSAKKRGGVCTLTIENLYQPSHCPVWGHPLDWTTPRGQRTGLDPRNTPSIDRWDNSNPNYTPLTARVVSRAVNTRKGAMSVEEARQLLAYMEKGPFDP